jgi:arginase
MKHGNRSIAVNAISPLQLIHVPLDAGAASRGADRGPAALLEAGLRPLLQRGGRTLADDIVVAVKDSNNPLHTQPVAAHGHMHHYASIADLCQRLAHVVHNSMRAGLFPLILGGDHALAAGSVAGVARYFQHQQRPLGVIWFDAHADINTPASSTTGNLHGMPLAHLLGLGDAALSHLAGAAPALQGRHVVIIGARAIDRAERDIIRATGVTVINMAQVRQLGIGRATRLALNIAGRGTAGIHLSFDVDGCDPATIPGTGLRVPDGMTLHQTRQCLLQIKASGRLCSMDVVELNPLQDPGGGSAQRVVNLLGELFNTAACPACDSGNQLQGEQQKTESNRPTPEHRREGE